MKPIYIAAYHQSVFGKLMGMSVPQIVANAVRETCDEIKIEPAALDVGSIGATCNISLNEQGLLAGLVAQVPGLEAKPIESVENACASGGQAVLSVIQKMQSGLDSRRACRTDNRPAVDLWKTSRDRDRRIRLGRTVTNAEDPVHACPRFSLQPSWALRYHVSAFMNSS